MKVYGIWSSQNLVTASFGIYFQFLNPTDHLGGLGGQGEGFQGGAHECEILLEFSSET